MQGGRGAGEVREDEGVGEAGGEELITNAQYPMPNAPYLQPISIFCD